jgi:hypothetical protein
LFDKAVAMACQSAIMAEVFQGGNGGGMEDSTNHMDNTIVRVFINFLI